MVRRAAACRCAAGASTAAMCTTSAATSTTTATGAATATGATDSPARVPGSAAAGDRAAARRGVGSAVVVFRGQMGVLPAGRARSGAVMASATSERFCSADHGSCGSNAGRRFGGYLRTLPCLALTARGVGHLQSFAVGAPRRRANRHQGGDRVGPRTERLPDRLVAIVADGLGSGF